MLYKLLASELVALVSVIGISQTAIARESVPINSIVIQDIGSSGTVFASLSVPSRDNNRNFFDSELSVSDLHIAKMYEVTDALCQRRFTYPFNQNIQTFQWSYAAGGMAIAQLTISCTEAQNVFNSFGQGFLAETTTIRRPLSPGSPPSAEMLQIPTLNLAGYQAPRWKDFTRQLRLTGSY